MPHISILLGRKINNGKSKRLNAQGMPKSLEFASQKGVCNFVLVEVARSRIIVLIQITQFM